MKVTIQDSKTSVTVRPRDFRVTVSGARGPQGPPGEAGASEWGDIGGTLSNQTDLQTALDAKVPYTGATQDVNLGEYGAQLGNLEFDNTPTNVPTTAGSVYWNDTDGTLNIVLKGGQTISRVGETQHIRALNNTGAQIARGKVVYVVGAQGQRLTIALADADTEILSKDTIGFTAEAIADGSEGFVIVQGVINNVSTTGMIDGATVYLSQTAGSYTTTPPADPAHLVILGFIVNGGSGGAGSIYVKVDNGYELEELHNVSNSAKTTPVGDDALLLRDSADNDLWKRLTWTNALAGVKSHMDTFKSVAGGYASLDGSGKVPASELPSYVDDVVEVANYAALPGTGETGKIYVTLDTNKCYRWTGSVYVEVSAGVASAWGAITGTLSNQTDLQTALDGKVDENSPITGATKTKITYDAKGLVTAGADAAIADITGLQTALDGKQSTVSLTTTGTSGAATLVGSTLNIPQYQGVLTNPVTGTGTAGQVAYWSGTNTQTGSSSLVWDAANNRLGVGLNTGLTARAHVRGSGTTSATTALLVQKSDGSNIMQVRDDGLVLLNDIVRASATLNLYGQSGAVAGIILRSIASSETATSGTRIHVRVNELFAPTSGNCVLNTLQVDPTINQTGGANGITRGLYVNPTLTSAADWRSVEFSNNTGWGLYGAGTANNYLGGSLGIGTTTLGVANIKLSKPMVSGGVGTFYNINNDSQISSDVTFSAHYFRTSASTQNSAFNLNVLNHYSTEQGTFGAGSTVVNQYGFLASSSLTGATNNYGFYGNIASGTGRWNLYMNGTAANYLAGNTSIGTTTSSGRLTVQGSGTTSATKAFVVNNSTPTAIFEILDNGRINQTIPGASNNTIFGTGAGASASLSGAHNTIFGTSAGTAITTGGGNTMIGESAGALTTTGGSNVYVGRSAGGNNQTATTNTAVGTFAMLNHTTGGSNITKGFNAARYYADGTTNAVSFSECTYLGTATRVSGVGVTNEIVIGFNSIGNGSNTATLGNTSITATYLRGNINYTDGGNFVIGTTTGTKIGTATSQKIGLWNATPIAQPTTAVSAATRVGGGGTTVTDTDTFDGYTIAQLVKALRNMGALA